jgi:predicted metal-dependent hydrolase
VTQSYDPARKVPTRRVALEDSFGDVPRHFATGGDLLQSHFAAALSAVFPDGEEFFVRSVRRFRDQITDPELKAQVAGFIGQEAVHGREHRAFNDRLDELGYPTRRVERVTDRLLRFREEVLPAKSNLAVTAALEHFTATMAETLLTSQEIQDAFGHRAVKELFLWHALEESEHKAVAFDVYKAVGGSERTRVMTMNFLRFAFLAFTATQMAVSLATDPATYRPGNLRASWRRFRRFPLVSKEVWQALKEYNRPGFHPLDQDNSELVEEWRRRLFGEDGVMKDKLARPVAA